MTKHSSLRSAVAIATAVFLSSFVLLSCKKDHGNNNGDPLAAGLMVFNLSPDNVAAGFALSGNQLIGSPLTYPNYSGNYLSIYPGQRTIETYDFNSHHTLASAQGNFIDGKFYSAFFLGTDSSYRNLLVNDNVDSLSGSSGKAYIRYVNAIPDSINSPTVTITSSNANIVNEPASYATASGFIAANPGDINISVKTAATNINVQRTISLEQKKVYTILLVGKASSSPVPAEIKFVENGTLSDQ